MLDCTTLIMEQTKIVAKYFSYKYDRTIILLTENLGSQQQYQNCTKSFKMRHIFKR